MTNLNQQLEDKKKELKNLLKSMDGYGYSREDTIKDFEKWDYDMFGDKEDVHKYHKLKAEIAILEQAIAEMQKQRQEILKLIKQEISKDVYSYTFECRLNNFLKNGLKKQLNQPKTEETKHL